MKSAISLRPFMVIGVIIRAGCSQPPKLEIARQVTGLETNCYLLYDTGSRQAALFDVGGPIESLVNIIEKSDLDLRYFLCTHGHGDHVVGLPRIRQMFPNADLCIHKQDFEDLFTAKQWLIEFFSQDSVDLWSSENPEFRKLMEFDPESLDQPDIFLDDNRTFRLGEFEIRTIHAPGHSPGSICFHVDNMLFFGDVLFYRKVGRTGRFHGSPEDMISSIRELYTLLPDETVVYPAHGELTDIGSEKKENQEIRADTVLSLN